MDSQRRTGAAEPLRPGDPERVGSYTILGRIGEGGMGAVYLAQGPDGRKVAVKVVRPELARDAGFVARFKDEVANAQLVASFCTAQVLDHGEFAGRAYMVTEHIDGVSLLEYVNQNGELSPGMLQGVAVGVAAALVAIHSAGLIHRDLKPANVLLSFSGPRVIDFGIARALDAASGHTMTGQLIGSPGWMAPEQILRHPVTTAVDIFAWGCLVAYAGNGINPFGRGDFSVMAARLVHGEPELGALPAPLDRLVRRALDKEPRNRPTAKDLLLTMVGGAGAEAAALGTLTPSWQPPVSSAPPVPPPHSSPHSPPPPVPSPPHEETRRADQRGQEQRHPSPGPPMPYPVPAPTPTSAPAPVGYRSEPLRPSAMAETFPGHHPSAAANTAGAPTRPAGPSDGPPTVAPPLRPPVRPPGRRRAALVAAVTVILAGGAGTAWAILGSDGGSPADNSATYKAPSSASASVSAPAGPAALPGDPLLVRVDRQPGWPDTCHGNVGMLTPQASEATLILDDTSTCDTLPQWSPDHQRIAFTRSTRTTSALWIMNRDGSGASMVTDKLTGRMAWSPDGTRIAGMGNTGTVHQIFVINLSDRKLQQITTDSSKKNDPAWCGSRLAFWSGDTVDTQQIYTVDPTYPDTQWKKVTRSPRGVNDPAWSPDCKKIAYTDDKNIWVTSADGTGAKQLTSGATLDMDPNWSRNGDWITFVRGTTPHPRIWAMHADGKDAKRIGPDQDIGHPDWY